MVSEKIVITDREDDSLTFDIDNYAGNNEYIHLWVNSKGGNTSAIYVTPELLYRLASELQRVAASMGGQSPVSQQTEVVIAELQRRGYIQREPKHECSRCDGRGQYRNHAGNMVECIVCSGNGYW